GLHGWHTGRAQPWVPAWLSRLKWPREGSNLRTRIRSPPLYPLSYGASPSSMPRVSDAEACATTSGREFPLRVFPSASEATDTRMPRAIWTGSISFGLVNVPVRLYSAIAEHKLRFHLIHEPDESPIGYQKICKLENKPVPDDEIAKAFEFKRGEFVVME